MVALGLCFVNEAVAQSSSPAKSPPPQTPEQKLSSARTRLAQAQQRVKTTWPLVKQSRDRLAKAQQDYDEVMDQLRGENSVDAFILDAATQIREARVALESQRKTALESLRLNFAFGQLQREHLTATIRLEDLTKARQQADAKLLPFDPALQAEIGRLSLSLLKLNDDVAAMEDERLDDHEGYQAASEAMDKALTEAAEAIKSSRQLREGNPRRQAAVKALQAAFADAAATGKAYADARRQRQQAAVAALAAQNEFDAIRRK